MAPKQRKGHPIDVHVGGKMRMRRVMLGLSQEKLGDALGITFQQVQKYEKGDNRISASRLYEIAQILEVPVAFFFEGLEKPDANGATAQLHDFLATAIGLAFMSALVRMGNRPARGALLVLVQKLADEASPP